MKKLSLLFCAVFASATLFAGTAIQNKAVDANVTISKNAAVKAEFSGERNVTTFNLSQAKKATVASMETDTMLALYRNLSPFMAGIPNRGLGYAYDAMFVSPFVSSVLYYNAYIFKAEWEVSGTTYSGDKYVLVKAGEYGEEVAVPTLSYVENNPYKTSDTTQIYFAPYTFGTLWNEGTAGTTFVAPDYLFVTQSGYLTDYHNVWVPSYDGWGWLPMGGSLGDYSYGTKTLNPWMKPDTVITPISGGGNDTTLAYHYFDSIVTIVENSETMYIEEINLGVWTTSANNEYFPDSANDVITMTILPLINDSTIDWDNPIAITTAGKADLITNFTYNKWFGSLHFKFYAEDPATHAKKRVPIVVDSAFVVVLSGLSKNTTDLGFLTDYYDDAPSAKERTFFVDYSEGERALESVWRYPANLIMSFGSVWPSIQGLPETVNVPLAGGEFNFTLPTNVWAEDMEMDFDDWIDIEAESVTEGEGDDEEFLYQVKATVTVDAATADRQGEIEIDALGKIYTITVNQSASTSIENTVKKVNDNKLYNVLGMEVDENYKGVVIRNGEKFLQ